MSLRDDFLKLFEQQQIINKNFDNALKILNKEMIDLKKSYEIDRKDLWCYVDGIRKEIKR